MANEQNLINLKDRSPEERREIAKKGAAASIAAKRKKEQMREAMQMLLSLPVKNAKNKKMLIELGIDPDDADNQFLILAAAMNSALKGDVRAMEFIRNVERMDIDAERLKLEKKKFNAWQKELREAKEAAAKQAEDNPAIKQVDAVLEVVNQMKPPDDDEVMK